MARVSMDPASKEMIDLASKAETPIAWDRLEDDK